jgi:serine/threonine protein kinase
LSGELQSAINAGWLNDAQLAVLIAASQRQSCSVLDLAQRWQLLSEAQVQQIRQKAPGLNLATTAAERPSLTRLPKPGEVLAGAKVLRELGRGGMGAVYLAEGPQGLVALKVMISADSRSLKRFETEARAAAAAGAHPNIVSLRALDFSGPMPVLAFDYIQGQSLAEVLRDGPPKLSDARRWLAEIASALQHLHSLGYVHRDLKPANILIREDDRSALLTDFGAARGDAEGLTRTGELIGTPLYMAPEQFDSSLGAPGPQTDLWAFAVVAYELLTGHCPFQGENLQVLATAILCFKPPSASSLNPELSRSIDEVFSWAFRQDLHERVDDVQEWFDALDDALLGRKPTTFKHRTSQLRIVLPLAWISACLTLLFSSWLLFQNWRWNQIPASAQTALKSFQASRAHWFEQKAPQRLALDLLKSAPVEEAKTLGSSIGPSLEAIRAELELLANSGITEWLSAELAGDLEALCLVFQCGLRGAAMSPVTARRHASILSARELILAMEAPSQRGFERSLEALDRSGSWGPSLANIARVLRHIDESADWTGARIIAKTAKSSDGPLHSISRELFWLCARQSVLRTASSLPERELESSWSEALESLESLSAVQRAEFWKDWVRRTESTLASVFDPRGAGLLAELSELQRQRRGGAAVAPRFGEAAIKSFKTLSRSRLGDAARLALILEELDSELQLPFQVMMRSDALSVFVQLDMKRFVDFHRKVYLELYESVDRPIYLDAVQVSLGASREGFDFELPDFVLIRVLQSGELDHVLPPRSADPFIRYHRALVDFEWLRQSLDDQKVKPNVTPGALEEALGTLRLASDQTAEQIKDFLFAIRHEAFPRQQRFIAWLRLAERLLQAQSHYDLDSKAWRELGSAEGVATLLRESIREAAQAQSALYDQALVLAYLTYGAEAESIVHTPVDRAWAFFEERSAHYKNRRFLDPDGRRWHPFFRYEESRARLLRQLAEVDLKLGQLKRARSYAELAYAELEAFKARNPAEQRRVKFVLARSLAATGDLDALKTFAERNGLEAVPEELRGRLK